MDTNLLIFSSNAAIFSSSSMLRGLGIVFTGASHGPSSLPNQLEKSVREANSLSSWS